MREWLNAVLPIFFMDEILRLLRENNLMLKAICKYLAEHDKEDLDEDAKDFVANIVANIYANKLDSRQF